MSTWTSERAKLAALTRSRTPDDPELIEARRNLKALKLEEHVQRTLESWPPLTPDQCQRVASLLCGAR